METYPYPLRPSELVKTQFLDNVQPLNLNEEERSKLQAFEGELFNKLKPLKDVVVSTHVIYLDLFKTDKGKRMFAAIYLDPNLRERMDDADPDFFFKDLLNTCDSEEEFEKYRNNQFARPGDLSIDQIKDLFYKTDLSLIPEKVRKKVNSFSSDYSMEEFKKSFENKEGNVRKIENPERISKVVEPNKLTEKLIGLRKLKLDIKKNKKEIGTETQFSKSQNLILDLYQKYINTLIAGEAEDVRILLSNPDRLEQENEALKAAHFSINTTSISRSMERLDHFFAGVGVHFRKDELLSSIPLRLARYAGARMKQERPEETRDYKKYNKYKLDSEDLMAIINLTLQSYGLEGIDKPWSVNIEENRKTLSVSGNKRRINIPANFNRGLIDTLGVVAHEVEGHVLRYANKNNSLIGNFKIIEELSTGRSGILSEGAAMRVEDDTNRGTVGQVRLAEPYYYLAIARKEKGGSFRACLKTVFKARAARVYGKNVSEAIKDPEIFQENFEYAYTRTMRIFRRNTPLNDTSGTNSISDQLEYIEQELVLDTLSTEENKERGINKILYIAGIDLYSIKELIQLGALDLNNIKEPKLTIAKDIWPKIKAQIDSGMSVKEAIESFKKKL